MEEYYFVFIFSEFAVAAADDYFSILFLSFEISIESQNPRRVSVGLSSVAPRLLLISSTDSSNSIVHFHIKT